MEVTIFCSILIGILFINNFHHCNGLYRCAEGWSLHGRHCYHFNLTQESRVTWHQARHLCEETMGAQMISISSQEQQDYLQRISKSADSTVDQMWLGLYDTGRDNTFVWTNQSLLLRYKNWAENEPSNVASNCVIMREKWQDTNCDLKFLYICEKGVPNDSNGLCPSGWHKYVGSCYQIQNNTSAKVTWRFARNKCQRFQADLVTIDYPEENSFLYGLLGTNASDFYWIGLNDRESEGQWRWNNNKDPVQWYNWYQSFPDNGNKGPKNCVRIIGPHSQRWRGTWNPRYCLRSSAFICKSKAKFVGEDMACDESWKRNGDFCYFMGKNLTSWETARRTCQYKGGDLASIESASEVDFILDDVFSGERYAWIGLHNKNGTNDWFWLNQTKPASYKNWIPWEPWESKQFTCVMMHATGHNLGTWDNVQCDLKFPFICQGFNKSAPCRSPWKAFEGECYLVRLSAVNWYRGRNICQNLRPDADLAEVDSLAYQYFLNGLITNNAGYGGFWIGLNSLQQWQTYEWLNQSRPVIFTNWDVGQPDHINDDGCVSISMKSDSDKYGKWLDSHCFQRFGFGCQSDAATTFYDFAITDTMYKFIGEQLAHAEAEEYCKLTLGDGAELATIDSNKLWLTLISNVRLHRTRGPKQLWVGSVDADLLSVDDTAVRESSQSGVLHDVKDWCIYLSENTTKPQWTQEYKLVKNTCYSRKYSICQKTSSILQKYLFSFVVGDVEYTLIRDVMQVRPDLNTTCRILLGSDEARVAVLETDDHAMALFTEIRAVHTGNQHHRGYWVDVQPQNQTLLKQRVHSLALSTMCPLMRLEKFSSDWSIQTAIKTVKSTGCSEYHQFICQRNLSNEEIIQKVSAWNVEKFQQQNETRNNVTTKIPETRQDPIIINSSDDAKYTCTGTCIGLAVVLTIMIIICLCLLATVLYMKRRWIRSFFETAPDVVRLSDRAEPTSYTDPPPQSEEDASQT